MDKYRLFLKGVDFASEVLIVLLLSLIWCRYFIDSLTFAIVVSIVLTSIAGFALAKKKIEKDKKHNEKLLTAKKQEDFKNLLLFSNPKDILCRLQKEFGGNIVSNNILINNDKLLALYTFEVPLKKEKIIELIQNIDTQKFSEIHIYTLFIDADCLNFVNNISNIKFYVFQLNDFSKYYENELSSDNLKNNTKIRYKQNAIITFKTFLLLLLRPQNTKGYFFSALIILFASLIVPQKLYYYIFASILLMLCFISKIKYKTK